MNRPTTIADEFWPLLDAACDGELTERQRAKLETFLEGDPDARRTFLDHIRLRTQVRLWRKGERSRKAGLARVGAADGGPWAASGQDGPGFTLPSSEIPDPDSPIPGPAPAFPSIVLDPRTTPRHALGLFAPGGFLFSYGVSAVIVVIGLLIGWAAKVASYRDFGQHDFVVQHGPRQAPVAVEQGPPMVGQITGLLDCRWADPSIRVFDREHVPLGRKFDLVSGYLEITYDSGAKVILQGPASYEVESRMGGFLSLGKLTALVEKADPEFRSQESESKGERTANPALSQRGIEPTVSLAPRPSPVSPRPTGRGAGSEGGSHDALFSVRTPTATVTDLGTEFGVEVDKAGASRAHVFRGKVEMRPVEGGKEMDRVISLGPNESATVDIVQNRVITATRGSGPSNSFARQMPKWVAIKVFSTGAGLQEGDPDLHWQIVARSDEPGFKPRPAVVSGTVGQYLSNDPAKSQWLSTASNLPYLPEGVTFTFRTTFELAGVAPATAILRGGFIADNHVDAVRLNGRPASVPKHGYGYDEPFLRFRPLTIDKGFVEGTNVLEVDVFNGDQKSKQFYPNRLTPMALRLELQGFALRGGGLPATGAGATPPERQKGGPPVSSA